MGKEESKQVRFRPSGKSDWEYKGPHRFESAYSRTVHKWYDASFFDRYSLEYPLGNDTDYPCAFCGRRSPEVTFKKVAHILPACIGNDIYLSKEECDSCNDRMNQLFDSDFGAMTSSIRGLFRYPNRKGRADWTPAGGPSKVDFDAVRGLSILVSGENSPVRFEVDPEKKLATIFGPGFSYRPAPAIMALVHAAWLFMTAGERLGQPLLLSMLNSTSCIEPFYYFTGTEPGYHPHHVRFEVYERKVSDPAIPSIFIKLSLGSYYFAWASPSPELKSYLPMPPFPFKVIEEGHLPNMTLQGVKEYGSLIKGDTSEFSVIFEGSVYSEGPTPVPPAAKPPLKSVAVRLRVHGVTSLEQDGIFLRLLNLRSSDPHVVISGPKFLANFEVPFEGDLKTAISFHMKLKIWGQPATDVFRTVRMLDAICQPAATIEIIGSKDEMLMRLCTPKEGQTITFDLVLKVSQMLMELGDALGRGFYFPAEIDDDGLDALTFLHNSLVRKVVPDEKGTYSMKVDWLDAKALKTLHEGKMEFGLGLPQSEKVLFGQKLTVPAHHRTMSNYEVISPAVGEELDPEGTLVIRYHGVRCDF